jgi:hypothetical protein
VDASTGVQLPLVGVVAEALRADAAWTTILPQGTDTLARLVRDDATPLLVHPLGALELRQQRVPLETEIDRIGSASVTAKRVHLAEPQVGKGPAGAVAHASDQFPPGHFLDLTQDQQASRPDFETFPSGMQVTASRTPVYGDAAAVVQVQYAWETAFPHERFARAPLALEFRRLSRHAFRTNAVASAARQRSNPYAPRATAPAGAKGVRVTEHGRVVVRRADDLTTPAGISEILTTTEATRRIHAMGAEAEDAFALVAAGVTP